MQPKKAPKVDRFFEPESKFFLCWLVIGAAYAVFLAIMTHSAWWNILLMAIISPFGSVPLWALLWAFTKAVVVICSDAFEYRARFHTLLGLLGVIAFWALFLR